MAPGRAPRIDPAAIVAFRILLIQGITVLSRPASFDRVKRLQPDLRLLYCNFPKLTVKHESAADERHRLQLQPWRLFLKKV